MKKIIAIMLMVCSLSILAGEKVEPSAESVKILKELQDTNVRLQELAEYIRLTTSYSLVANVGEKPEPIIIPGLIQTHVIQQW